MFAVKGSEDQGILSTMSTYDFESWAKALQDQQKFRITSVTAGLQGWHIVMTINMPGFGSRNQVWRSGMGMTGLEDYIKEWHQHGYLVTSIAFHPRDLYFCVMTQRTVDDDIQMYQRCRSINDLYITEKLKKGYRVTTIAGTASAEKPLFVVMTRSVNLQVPTNHMKSNRMKRMRCFVEGHCNWHGIGDLAFSFSHWGKRR